MKHATFLALILAGVTGCATIEGAAARSTEQMLAAAGFHVQVADTPEKVAQLRALPPRKLVAHSEQGLVFYVFADPVGCNCSYVGGEREYQQYQRLRLEEEPAGDTMNCRGWPWCIGYGG